ncbi:hypothetical protein IP84_03750 [beta proteobacterium AAP99]|nr:hypothetical protein IP84_03750 [beta proteobacterium AAP99]
MPFQISGLNPQPFAHLHGLSDAELAQHHAVRYVADAKPGFPDRILMRDAEPGESLLLVNHEHLPVDSPYRSRHAIFVLEDALAAGNAPYRAINAVPEVLRPRLLSLRGFDAQHMIVDADVVDGREVEALIERLLSNDQVRYIHAHFAKRGCYAGLIERA